MNTIKTVAKIIGSAVTRNYAGTASQPKKRGSRAKNREQFLFEPAGKTCLITGGSGGMGLPIAEELLKQEAKEVVLIGLSTTEGIKAVEDLKSTFGSNKAYFVKSDISDICKTEELLNKVTSESGKLHLLVNSAGIWDSKHWDKEIKTNLYGLIMTNIIAEKYMVKGSTILNMSGTWGLDPISEEPTLSACYNAIIYLTRCFGHKSNNRSIRRICLCPGFTKTYFITQVEQKTLTHEMADDMESRIHKGQIQATEPLKGHFMHLMRHAESGSVWVWDNNNLFSVDFPDWKKHACAETEIKLERQFKSFNPRVIMNTQTSTSAETTYKKNYVEDKVALVTGGANGIGYHVVRELLHRGAYAVTIVDKDASKGEEVVSELGKEFGDDKILFYEVDVTDSKKLDVAINDTVLHFQGLDIMVNSFGIMNDTKWEDQIKTNLSGMIVSTLMGMQTMSKIGVGNGGTIVNVSSIMGLVPSTGYPLHTMTQFGIVGFTRALGGSDQFKRNGVKILGFCPGITNTKLIKNATKNAINEHFAFEFIAETERSEIQEPENVAYGLLDVIEESKSGSIWVAENDQEPFEINFPDISKLREEINDDKKCLEEII